MARSSPPTRPAPPEFIWDGKYDAAGRRTPSFAPHPLPHLHVMERYGTLPASAAGWRNRLVLGENRLALHALAEEFRGQVQLIYIDPPFEVGTDFQLSLPAGSAAGGKQRGLAYRDKWGSGTRSYLHMMYERLVLLRPLLRETGGLFLHCDWRNSAPLRLMLDEVFGRDRFVNEIVWHYYNKYSGGKGCLPRAHDTILLYGKSAKFTVNPLRLPRDAPQRQLVRKAVQGVLKNAKGPDGRVIYRIVTDKKADDVWDLPQLQPASPHWTGYGTQKHHDLLSRIIALGSKPGDLVLDAFCGSGTTLSVAESLGRRWIGCDLGHAAVHIARRRLWSLGGDPTACPFDLCTLGTAEPEAFVRTFSSREAYVAHVLGRIRAKPATGVREIDATLGKSQLVLARNGEEVAAAQVERAARAVKASARRPLTYIAWSFAPGLWEELETRGLDTAVRPMLLPRNWLGPADAIDSPPLPLPRITTVLSLDPGEGGSLTLTLTEWQAPERHFSKARRGAQGLVGLEAVDAWAVHAGWRPGEPFTPQAIAYRTRRQPLVTSLSVHCKTGGSVLIKAWDGFGREGTAVLALPSRRSAPGKRRRVAS